MRDRTRRRVSTTWQFQHSCGVTDGALLRKCGADLGTRPRSRLRKRVAQERAGGIRRGVPRATLARPKGSPGRLIAKLGPLHVHTQLTLGLFLFSVGIGRWNAVGRLKLCRRTL
jgi:hypothetical protein